MSRKEILKSIDPELRSVARLLPPNAMMHRGPKLPRAFSALLARVGAVRGTEVTSIPGAESVRIHRPSGPSGAGPALLWIHGGGTIIGAASQDDRFCRALADRIGVVVVSVDYRLAPEHPAPAAVHDCVTALEWIAQQPWADASRLAVAGASAGGLLAASVALEIRDSSEIDLAALALVYPMLDNRTGGPESPSTKDHLLWTARDNQLAWGWYIGAGDPHVVAPGRRDDLAGLAPTWIGVGTEDLFFAEGETFHGALVAAGVTSEFHPAPGAFHGFDQVTPKAEVTRDFTASMVEHLRGHLA